MKTNALFLAVASVLSVEAQAAPETLSTTALDAVVAGNESLSESESDATHPSVVVAERSEINVNIDRSVAIQGSAQAGASAFNVVNGAQLDSAIGANVLLDPSVVAASQSNSITQQERIGAQAASIERRGLNRSIETGYSGRSESASATQSFNEQILKSSAHDSMFDTFNADVPGYFPFQNLSVTVGTPDLPAVTVPAFTIGVEFEGIGVSASIGPFTFDPPQIVLGTVSLSGNDIVLKGGFVDLGYLDLGSATLSGCLGKLCASTSVDLPTIDGPRIDFGEELRIEGANPFKDIKVNAGGGVSVAGRGHIAMDLGHVTVSAQLTLDLPDLTTSFDFNVLGQEVSSGKFGVVIPPVTASIDLIDSDVGVAYTADFNGALCLSIVSISCSGLQHREHNESSRDESHTVTASSSQSSSSSYFSFGSDVATSGAHMSGAEGNVIAMSDGAANVTTDSVVQLDAQAQRGMKVFNAVNATGTMVGNALNLGAQRSATAASGSLAQSNAFSQFQTRPRGH